MSIGYDPLMYADNYKSKLESAIVNGELDWQGAKELYERGLISLDELYEAASLFEEKEKRGAKC